MNGGYCTYLEEQQTVACECPELYGGKGVKNFYGLLENARGKCLHQMFN